MNAHDILTQLTATIETRKTASPENSYVAKLFAKGLDTMLKKVGEEATEVVIAAKSAQANGDTSDLVYESADLVFHLMVTLAQYHLSMDDVLIELARREGLSGLAEKAARVE